MMLRTMSNRGGNVWLPRYASMGPTLDDLIRAIYASGRLGPWFDPSDLTTMYATRTGSTLVGMPGNGTAQFVGRMEDKSGGGHNALAANDSTARPQLVGRVNLCAPSFGVTNAAFLKLNITASGDTITETAATGLHYLSTSNTVFTSVIGVSYTAMFDVLPGAGATAPDYIQLGFSGGPFPTLRANFRLSTLEVSSISAGTTATIKQLPDGKIRVSFTATATAAGNTHGFIFLTNNNPTAAWGPSYAGSVTSDLQVFRSDIRPADIHAAGSIPEYQQVIDPETYDSVGFPYRLIPNGTGQALQTSTITPGTDSVTVGVGIRKLSDAAYGTVMEFGPTITANGTLYIAAPVTAADNIGLAVKGTIVPVAMVVSGVTAPITLTILAKSVISTPIRSVVLNNGSETTSAASLGAGNFATDVLNLFSRNGASLWFGGQYFGQIMMYGPQLTASELATVEAWINSKTKAY